MGSARCQICGGLCSVSMHCSGAAKCLTISGRAKRFSLATAAAFVRYTESNRQRSIFLSAMRHFRLIFVLVAVFAAVPFAFAAPNSADVAHLHVQLVVPNQNLAVGTSVNAGLYFKLESGWHVYWKNAGDSGE